MAMFSESGLEASGFRAGEKLQLCEKCGLSLYYVPEQGFCCLRGHDCRATKQAVICDSLDATNAREQLNSRV